MVFISKEDQDKVTHAIEKMEQELKDLRSLLGDIALSSTKKGHLQVGDTIEIVKKAGTPDSSPVVRRAVVLSLEYRIHNLQVKVVQDGVSSDDDNVPMITHFDPKEHTVRKVDPGDGDDWSEGSGISYHEEGDLVDISKVE